MIPWGEEDGLGGGAGRGREGGGSAGSGVVFGGFEGLDVVFTRGWWEGGVVREEGDGEGKGKGMGGGGGQGLESVVVVGGLGLDTGEFFLSPEYFGMGGGDGKCYLFIECWLVTDLTRLDLRSLRRGQHVRQEMDAHLPARRPRTYAVVEIHVQLWCQIQCARAESALRRLHDGGDGVVYFQTAPCYVLRSVRQ